MKVVIEKIEKKYIQQQHIIEALSPISLTVHENEFIALVGPSGCGKSTLLNILGGFLRPSGGDVYFSELTENTEPSVGSVFQDIGLYPWLTVAENIAFGLEELPLTTTERHERVTDKMSLVGLESFAHVYPHQLSGGMQQRVGIARALAIHPDLLLMDEPFSALDAQTRQLMQEELVRILEQTKVTTIYVTHNINEAVFLADRVVVMSGRPGSIKEIIPIDLPRENRHKAEYMPHFTAYVDKIWHLIRKDAETALREGGGQ